MKAGPIADIVLFPGFRHAVDQPERGDFPPIRDLRSGRAVRRLLEIGE